MKNDQTIKAPGFAPLLEALAFAAEKHRNQRRKDAECSPYINHPIALAQLLATTGGVQDIDVLRAAVLHDTLEDTETTREELAARFGEAVAAIVEELSDDKSLPKQTRKQLQIDHAPHASAQAALVKIADKICNLRDIAQSPPADWSEERRRDYYTWAKAVVDRLPVDNPALMSAFAAAFQNRP